MNNDHPKKSINVVCPKCFKNNNITITCDSFDRQEHEGTLETFYCDCGRYIRVVKVIGVRVE